MTPSAPLVIVPLGAEFLAFSPEELAQARDRAREILGAGPLADRTATTQSSERLLTASEISSATPGIPAAWYLEHARQGLIPYVKFGRYVRFRLDKVIEHGAVTPPAEAGGKWTRKKDKRGAP